MKKLTTRKTLLWQVMLWGSLLNLALVGLILLQYPSLLETRSVSTVIICVLLLLLYGCVGIGLPLRGGQAVTTALWQGTGFGLLIGVIFAIDIFVEYFPDLGRRASMISTLGFMGLIFCLFGLASARGAQKTGQMYLGILTSVWSAMLSVIIALLFGFAMNFFFIQRLEYILYSDYVSSGMSNLQAYTFFNSLDSASSHLLEAPVLAVVFGTIGSLISKGLISLQEQH